MKLKNPIPFFIITFALSWSMAAVMIFYTDWVVELFGEISHTNPLYILMAYSPGIVGTLMVWKTYGLKGLRRFFKRLTLWKMPLVWWVYLVLGIPVLAYIAAALKGSINDPFPFSSWTMLISVLAQGFFLSGTLEEFGWRGVAQPLLQRKLAPFWSGLILGLIIAVWHLPAFLFGGGVQYSNWAVLPFIIGVVSIYIILTPMFNISKGSLLIPYLYHFQMMNPLFPDTQPWDNYVFGIVAIIVVILNRKTMFKKGSGVTEILMPIK